MILVPLDTPGVTIERSTTVYGYDDGPHGGHGVIHYDHVRVPRENLLGPQGGGFMMAQARLGPGRIHHCMRSLGMAERALELMCARAASRDRRSASRSRSTASCRSGSPSRGWRSTRPGCSCSTRRG